MRRKRLLLAVLLGLSLLTATSAYAQLNLPYTSFVPGQVISSAQFTTDLTQISANALNRTGGTMTGGLLFSADNSFDIGASGATRPRDFWLGRNASIGGSLTVGGASTFAAITSSGLLTLSGGAPELSLTNGTSNWIAWTIAGVAAPTFTTSSSGTKLLLYPNVNATNVDIALGVETQALWQSVRLDTDKFYWYHGQTRTLSLGYDGGAGTYTVPVLNVFPGADSLGARIQIVPVGTANAPAVFQAGEPGVTASGVILANNYHATSTAASARINTSIGGSYLKLVNDGTISLNRISSGGTISTSASWDASGNFTAAGTTTTAGLTNSGVRLETAVISPPALSADVNDYNPTGLSTAATVRIDPGGANRNITGLAAQSGGTVMRLCNIAPNGSGFFLTPTAESASSLAANRFAVQIGGITPGQCFSFWYDTTSSRWRLSD